MTLILFGGLTRAVSGLFAGRIGHQTGLADASIQSAQLALEFAKSSSQARRRSLRLGLKGTIPSLTLSERLPTFCAQRRHALPRIHIRGFLLRIWPIRYSWAPNGAMKAKAKSSTC